MKLPSHNAAIKERQLVNREKRAARYKRITMNRLRKFAASDIAEAAEKCGFDLKSQSKTLGKLLKENKIG